MERLFEDYKDGFDNNQNIKNIDYLLQDFASKVCNAIDDELYDLLTMVEDGEHSIKEIANKIQDIRTRIY